jgi:hypothetical protein
MDVLAKRLILMRARQAVEHIYKGGRLVFKDNGQVEYTDKSGQKHTSDLDGVAQILLDTMAKQLTSGVGDVLATPEAVGIDITDIRKILEGLQRK